MASLKIWESSLFPLFSHLTPIQLRLILSLPSQCNENLLLPCPQLPPCSEPQPPLPSFLVVPLIVLYHILLPESALLMTAEALPPSPSMGALPFRVKPRTSATMHSALHGPIPTTSLTSFPPALPSVPLFQAYWPP